MSTSVVRKKCGTGPSDAASRLAIVLRIWVSGTSRYAAPPTGWATATRGTATATAPALSRSRMTTRPPGPEPRTSFKSTPRSLASRRASGEARTTRVASAGATGTGAGAGFVAGAGAADGREPTADDAFGPAAAAAAGAESTFSPGAPTIATVAPTGTVA